MVTFHTEHMLKNNFLKRNPFQLKKKYFFMKVIKHRSILSLPRVPVILELVIAFLLVIIGRPKGGQRKKEPSRSMKNRLP